MIKVILPMGETKGDLKLKAAATVSAESRHRKIEPKSISFPIRTSTGRLAEIKEEVIK